MQMTTDREPIEHETCGDSHGSGIDVLLSAVRTGNDNDIVFHSV